ncbi:MAG: hypothetical protein RLZZ618_1140 [Pseudomonadota bacterium]|jgi:hypothetical protein
MHLIRTAIALLIPLTAASGCCMYTTANFAVANSTPEPVRLTYALRGARDCTSADRQGIVPRLASVQRLSTIGDSTVVSEYRCDPQSLQITLTLASGQGVSLFRDSPVVDCTGGPRDPVSSLTVAVGSDVISATGKQVRALFTRRSSELYVLELGQR